MARFADAFTVLAVVPLASACTYFEVRSPVSGVPMVLANTLEWLEPHSGQNFHTVVVPRGTAQNASCVGGESWESRFGLVALQDEASHLRTDVLNEVGLSVTMHALRGVASYRPDNATTTRCATDLITWFAQTFETVAAVRAALPTLAVLASGAGTTSAPSTQWAIADASGASIVVDYVGGALHLHDNRGVGVMTNDPEYAWHLRNLNNYVGLQSGWPNANEDITCDSEIGPVPTPVGHGQNLLGLPGDVSPASRFVRTFFMRSYALKATPPADLDEALVLADGVLNSQYIVKGFNAKLPSESGYDFTITCSLKVPERGLFFYRTYEDSRWRKVNLSAIDFTRTGATKPSRQGFASVDVTDEIRSGGEVV